MSQDTSHGTTGTTGTTGTATTGSSPAMSPSQYPRRSSLTHLSSRAPAPTRAPQHQHPLQQDYGCSSYLSARTPLPLTTSRNRLALSASDQTAMAATATSTNTTTTDAFINNTSSSSSSVDHDRASATFATAAHPIIFSTTTGGAKGGDGGRVFIPPLRRHSVSPLSDRQSTTLSASSSSSSSSPTPSFHAIGHSLSTNAGRSTFITPHRPLSSTSSLLPSSGLNTNTPLSGKRWIVPQQQQPPLHRSTHNSFVTNPITHLSGNESSMFITQSTHEHDVANVYRSGQRTRPITPFSNNGSHHPLYSSEPWEESFSHIDPQTTTTRSSSVGSSHTVVPHWMRHQSNGPSSMTSLLHHADIGNSPMLYNVSFPPPPPPPLPLPLLPLATEPTQALSQDTMEEADNDIVESEGQGRHDRTEGSNNSNSPGMAMLPDGHSGTIMASPGPALSTLTTSPILNTCHLLYLIPVTIITIACIITTKEICDEQLFSWLTVQAFLFISQIICACCMIHRQMTSNRVTSMDQRSKVLLLVFMIWTIIGVGILGADSNSRDPTCGLPMSDPVYALSFKIIVFHVWLIGLYFMPCSTFVVTHTLQPSITTSLSRTATKPMIDKLGSMPMTEGMFGGDPEEAICAICLGDYSLNEIIRFLPCQHHFHLDCVDQWLLTDKSCPLCKHDIDKPVKLERSMSIRLQNLNNNNFITPTTTTTTNNNNNNNNNATIPRRPDEDNMNWFQVVVIPRI
ncbi:MAG: hypothetical protein J3Q66DRAFT_402671 [Benniella sp.]|nr:MAG: hypothetical protein J3Q66DRAFT_402671 [Benniella sp.]